MTTRIELGLKTLANGRSTFNNNLVAELPDEEGIFDTKNGRLGLAFRRGGDGQRYVLVDTTGLPDFPKKTTIRVAVSRETGIGKAHVTPVNSLWVTTEAEPEQFLEQPMEKNPRKRPKRFARRRNQ